VVKNVPSSDPRPKKEIAKFPAATKATRTKKEEEKKIKKPKGQAPTRPKEQKNKSAESETKKSSNSQVKNLHGSYKSNDPLRNSHPPPESFLGKRDDLPAPENVVLPKNTASQRPATNSTAMNRNGEEIKRLPAEEKGVNAPADV
jgi:hypothetical protein